VHPLSLPYALPLLATATAAAALAMYAYGRRGERPEVNTFALLLLAVTWHAGAAAIEMLSPTLTGKVRAEIAKFAGTAALSPLWLAFALRYTRRGHWLSSASRAFLAAPGLTAIALAVTNEAHGWMWTGFSLDPASPAVVVEGYGPAFWTFISIHYGFILAAALLYVLTYGPAAPVFRRQIALMVAGALIPLLGQTVYLAGVYPVAGLDLTPFTFGLSAVLLATGLFRFELLDLQPIATREVLNYLSDGVVVLDTAGRVMDLNPAARRVLGLDDDAIGRPAPVILQGEGAPPDSPLDLMAAPVQIGSGEHRRWYQVSFSALRDGNQRPVGRVALLHDVTDEHLLEKLRSDLTHMLIHDLSNPLSAMQMALEMVQPEGSEQPLLSGQEAREALEIVRRSNVRAQRMISSLLDVTRLESGHMPVDQEKVQAIDLAETAVRDMRALADARGLGVTVDLPPDLPPVQADAELLDRVLRNLLSNAIKFTPAGGAVQVTARCQGEHVIFTVRDNGLGLPLHVQTRLFEKFVRGSAGPQGHGLGLAFCKLAVEAMGGRIWVESQPGDGAAFHFTLPQA
jgi:signal transduction histidine kinase